MLVKQEEKKEEKEYAVRIEGQSFSWGVKLDEDKDSKN